MSFKSNMTKFAQRFQIFTAEALAFGLHPLIFWGLISISQCSINQALFMFHSIYRWCRSSSQGKNAVFSFSATEHFFKVFCWSKAVSEKHRSLWMGQKHIAASEQKRRSARRHTLICPKTISWTITSDSSVGPKDCVRGCCGPMRATRFM